MPGSQVTVPEREVVLRRSNPDLADLFHEDFIEDRCEMSAWEWEAVLFSPQQLNQLMEQPCQSDYDDRLIILTNDWLSELQCLWNWEIRSPYRQIAGQRPYAFASLFNLVYSIQQLVYYYYWGDARTCRTFDHHQTIWCHVPRSDVTQARYTIAMLAKMGFGAWLEELPLDESDPPMFAMIYDFDFDCATRVLSWANVNEGGFVYPRLSLDLVFPVEDDIPEDYLFWESNNTPETNDIISSWRMGISDDETFPPDGYMWEIFGYVDDSPDPDASSETTWITLSDRGSLFNFRADDDNDDENPGHDGNHDGRWNDDNDSDNDEHIIKDEDEQEHNNEPVPLNQLHDDLQGNYHLFEDDGENDDDQHLSVGDNESSDDVIIDTSSAASHDTRSLPSSDLDTSKNKLYKEKEETVAVMHPPTGSEAVTTTTTSSSSPTNGGETTTASNNTNNTNNNNTNNNGNDRVHDTFLEALDRPLEGDIADLLFFLRHVGRQRQLASGDSEPRCECDNTPPPYEDDISPPEYSSSE
ncbi:hypothetical protein F5Y13DRAFT_187676 [Hypoxylon sp. FL1857]|nr:hypothetical protein F5Y13DRAFT_187676 [Hypoxylon sp. FL1857]